MILFYYFIIFWSLITCTVPFFQILVPQTLELNCFVLNVLYISLFYAKSIFGCGCMAYDWLYCFLLIKDIIFFCVT